MIWGLEFRVKGRGLRVDVSTVYSTPFMVWGLGFMVLGFRVRLSG